MSDNVDKIRCATCGREQSIVSGDDEAGGLTLDEARESGWSARSMTSPWKDDERVHSIELSCPFCSRGA